MVGLKALLRSGAYSASEASNLVAIFIALATIAEQFERIANALEERSK